MTFPDTGTDKAELVDLMESACARDVDWRHGRTFGLVYNAGDDVTDLLRAVHARFVQSNALSVSAFPSLRRFEAEVLAWSGELLGSADAVGSITSGGTESILMACKAARDWARCERPRAAPAQMLLPVTAHPAFHKAAHLLGMESVTVPTDSGFRADLEAVREAITDRTVMLVGCAPQFPQGVADPIPALAAMARERGILLHVDACLGGFFLPFLEGIGEPVPPFDFRVPGVTSISADLHKYGYASKGASVVLYRDRALRRHQFFVHADWPGGVYGSPTMAGARSGVPIAAAWAVMRFLGRQGFERLVRQTMGAARRLRAGIEDTGLLHVLGEPCMSVLAYGSRDIDVYALGDALQRKGWHVDRQQLPPSLHQMVSPAHGAVLDEFLDDLRSCAREVRGAPAPETGMAAAYGMMAQLTDRAMVKELVLDYMDGLDAE